MKITAVDIDKQLAAAIKKFGMYSYEDKGPDEIMDLTPIVAHLTETNDVPYVLDVLHELNKKKRNSRLVETIICMLDGWDEFIDSDDDIIKEYY